MDKSLYKKLSKEEIKNKLTHIQYKVTQENATERAYINQYNNNIEDGIYVDIVSGEPLFSSKDKFNSGCGWPSFRKPLDMKYVDEKKDFTHNMIRTEIRSKIGDCHLGHVFMDNPHNQGELRYCINSAALRFIPREDLKKEGYEEFLEYFNE